MKCSVYDLEGMGLNPSQAELWVLSPIKVRQTKNVEAENFSGIIQSVVHAKYGLGLVFIGMPGIIQGGNYSRPRHN